MNDGPDIGDDADLLGFMVNDGIEDGIDGMNVRFYQLQLFENEDIFINNHTKICRICNLVISLIGRMRDQAYLVQLEVLDVTPHHSPVALELVLQDASPRFSQEVRVG